MLGLNRVGAQRAAAAQTVASDNLLEHVLDAEAMAFVVCSGDGDILQAGGAIGTLIGLDTRTEVIGQPLHKILAHMALTHADGSGAMDFADVPHVLKAVTESGKSRRIVTLAATPDGRMLSVATFFPGDGTAIATLRDVSAIAADRMMLDAAVRGANAGYWTMDLQKGGFTYSDSVISRLSERERDIMQKHGLFSIIHKEDVKRISAQWQDIITGVAPFDLTYRVTLEEGGVMWQRSIGQLMRRADGSLTKAVAFVMDITEDMKNRADLEEARGLAKAKEDFIARMSHEIRTPLNAIIGMSDSLSDEPMSETVREVLDDIEQAAEDLFGLLSRTLDHAKLETGAVAAHFETAEPRAVLAACAERWRPKAKTEGLAFRLAIAPDVPRHLPIDSFRLRQCLDNLVGNAVKFTQSGTVTLAARTVLRGGRPHLAVIVQDTGIGMSEAQQTTVFDPYAQADGSITRRFGGTGLGLAICQQLVGLMKGEIKVRSEPGKGAAFLMFLPFDPEAAEGKDEAEPRDEAEAGAEPNAVVALQRPGAPQRSGPRDARLPFEGLSVLCVEDNPVNQKVVKRLIGDRVQQLHFASHGREALSVLNTVHVDVVLMDIHMPIMDGIETTMEIRQSEAPYANVIIIALTADPDYQQKRICKNIGMDDTIAKPVRREDIFQAFNRTMTRLNEDFGVRVALG